MNEIWKGSPSIIFFLGKFIIYSIVCFLGFISWIYEMRIGHFFYENGIKLKREYILIPTIILLFLPIILTVWNIIKIKTWSFSITDESIFETKGVFSQKQDTTELFRVKDYSIEKPFFLRIFRLSNIILITSDITDPVLTIYAIKEGEELMTVLRKKVEEQRKIKGVREFD